MKNQNTGSTHIINNRYTVFKSFAISAGAGSGKTYTLSRRYINAILGYDLFREDLKADDGFKYKSPALPSEILTLTYTEAAAAEMKERIFALMQNVLTAVNGKSLSKDKKADIPAVLETQSKEQLAHIRDTLSQAIKTSSHARISTIHGFCFDWLKINSDLLRIDTKLELIEDDQKEVLFKKSLLKVMESDKHRGFIADFDRDYSIKLVETICNKFITDRLFKDHFLSFSQGTLTLAKVKQLISSLYPLPLEEAKKTIAELKLSCDDFFINWCKTFIANFENFEAMPWSEVHLWLPDGQLPAGIIILHTLLLTVTPVPSDLSFYLLHLLSLCHFTLMT